MVPSSTGLAVGDDTMMRAIVSTSVRFRLLAIGLAGVLLLVGATQLQTARVDVLPEFTPTTVEVQTEALGLSAEEVEELVTVPARGGPAARRRVPRGDPSPSRSPGCRRS